MKKQPQKIESQKELDKLLDKRSHECPLECFVILNFGIKSSKDIYLSEKGNYCVYNHVDDSDELILHDKLMESSIGEAISKGALYKY